MRDRAIGLNSSIVRCLESHFEQLVALRRAIHQDPELAWDEQRTTGRLRSFLSAHGIDAGLGPRERGLIADVTNQKEPTSFFAVRGDIDAIPVHEATGLHYQSSNRGIMHACGHDAHATIVAGTLVVLNELIQQQVITYPVSLRGIFQPAEEVAQGAREMIRCGALADVAAILTTHVDSSRPVGRIGLRSGVQTAWCDDLTVTVHGQGGHGARPHENRDPVHAACQWVNAVYANLPRWLDSRNPMAISICEIQGGSTANVVPRQVTMRGTMRTLARGIRHECLEKIERVSQSIGEMTNTKINLEWGESVPSIHNNAELIDMVEQISHECLGEDSVDWIEPSMGSEDFAFYIQSVPGALIRVGSTTPGKQGFPLHSANFEIDEQAIWIGCQLMARSTLDWWERCAMSR